MKLLASLISLAVGVGATNMNGEYKVSTGTKSNVPFNDDYASKGHEYFDVWAPEMATHYGEVFWTDQHNQPLPKEIVERFKGKVMAITGYEQDQVMVNPVGKPGVNPQEDVSVPINWAYNHHYMMWMTGSYSQLQELPNDPDDVLAHGAPRKWVGVDTAEAALRSDPSMPTSQMFSEGNGGESRKSFHGYPNGFAQLIESPETWHITPMQIDTRNRDCGATPASINNCTKFVPGPEPKQARYGLGIPKDTNYSGVLECPCNSRFGGDNSFYGADTKTKQVQHEFAAQGLATCSSGETITSASDCFEAATAIGVASTNKTTSDPKMPKGCSIVATKDGTATAYYNTLATSTAQCSTSAKRTGSLKTDVGVTLSVALNASAGPSTFNREAKGEYCSGNHANVLGKFAMAKAGTAEAEQALGACEKFCAKDASCEVCSVDCSLGSNTRCQWVALPACGTVDKWGGLIDGDISMKTAGEVKITLSGPSDVWFGAGVGAHEMSDQPWTIVATPSGVFEQKIGTCGSEADHCPGARLNASITVVSNTVNAGTRTVVLTRPYAGKNKDYYSFSNMQATIPFIAAIGTSPTFGYHKAHSQAIITLLVVGEPTCVCDAGANGKICEADGSNCETFVKSCVPAPAGSLLEQKNPTCNSRQYAGGLRCCHHQRIMLDADQEVRPELLRYHMKIRFWFQEYKPAASKATKPSHYNLPRIYQQTEANAGEYDIPPAFATKGIPIPGYPNWPLNKPTPGTTCTGQCPNGPDCECIHTIHYKWTVGPMRLIYAGGHCHAPSCISIELYRNDTGELLCRQVSEYGQGNIAKDKYDEAGYVTLPPCLWGDDKGLEPSILLPAGTPLLSIKKNHNTHMGHYGEMASWQMRGVNF